jgi:hypothetical protein
MLLCIKVPLYQHDLFNPDKNPEKRDAIHAASKRPPNLVWLSENQTSTNSNNSCNEQEANKKQRSINYTRYVRSTLTLAYLLLYLVHSGRAQSFFNNDESR